MRHMAATILLPNVPESRESTSLVPLALNAVYMNVISS